MKNKRAFLIIFICCFWLSNMCLLWTQITPATSSPHPNKGGIPTQEEAVLANINMNRMCHSAADFGYDAAEKNLPREEMHKELKEILK